MTEFVKEVSNDDDIEDETPTSEDKHSLLGLPRELAIRIIENDCITIEDRMSLRLTCRRLESIVADSDYRPLLPYAAFPRRLSIRQEEHYDRSTTSELWKTHVIGLLNDSTVLGSVSDTRAAAYAHLMSRLFRRVHYKEVVLEWVTFKENSGSPGRLSIHQLLPAYIGCNSLDVKVMLADYHSSIFDVIATLSPNKLLGLEFLWERGYRNDETEPPVVIDEEYLRNLPPVEHLRIESNQITIAVSGATILSLLDKHRSVQLLMKSMIIEPETFVKATKLVAKLDGSLALRLHFPLLLRCLRLVGVGYCEGILTTLDSSVEIERKPCPSLSISNYEIRVHGTMIHVLNLSDRGESQQQTMRVLIGRLDIGED